MSRGRRREVDVNVDSRAFKKGLAKALENWAVSSEHDLMRAGLQVRNKAMGYSPVDTGRLRAGWQVEPGHDSKGTYVEIHNTVEYAAEVEKGHDSGGKRVPPAPMIIPALAEVLGMTGIGHTIEIKREG